MNFLIDLTSLADNFSGIERFALNITKNMIEQDSQNKYILLFKNAIHKEFEQYSENNNVTLKVIKGKNKLVFNQLILPFELYKYKADKYFFFAFPSPIIFYRPGIVNTIHDLTCWDFPKTMTLLSKWYFRISIRNAMLMSESIITVSNFSKSRIQEKFKSKKNIEVIYNGVSDTFLNFREDEISLKDVIKKYNLPEEYIMCLCTLEPRKNIELLIEAFLELKKDNKKLPKLVLAGRKGWKIEKIFEKIPNEYKDDIVVTGFIDDKELPCIYLLAKGFIFPSIYEGFGIPPIESLAMGTPVLVSDIAPLKEVCQNNAIYFKNNDKEELKKSLFNFTLQENQIKKEDLKQYAMRFNWKKESSKILSEVIKG